MTNENKLQINTLFTFLTSNLFLSLTAGVGSTSMPSAILNADFFLELGDPDLLVHCIIRNIEIDAKLEQW